MSPKVILFILGLSFRVDAFSSSLSLPRRQQSVSNHLKKSRLFYVPEEEEESSPISSFTSSWSLEQDWALIDQLPKFTVGEGSHIRTFWTQLLACTPILSEKSPDSLFRRCQELKSIQEKNNIRNTAIQRKRKQTKSRTDQLADKATHRTVIDTDRERDTPTDQQTQKPTDQQTDRPTDRRTDRPTDR